MYQRDYILRMIEMLGELIAGIFKLIRVGDFTKASQAIENAYYDFLKKDASFFRNLKKENIVHELLQYHNYVNGHLEILSELFYADAEYHYAHKNFPLSLEFYEKALILFEFVEKESKTFSLDKKSKIESVKDRIKQLSA